MGHAGRCDGLLQPAAGRSAAAGDRGAGLLFCRSRLLGKLVPQAERRSAQLINTAISVRDSASLLWLGSLLWSGTRVFEAMILARTSAYAAEPVEPIQQAFVLDSVRSLLR